MARKKASFPSPRHGRNRVNARVQRTATNTGQSVNQICPPGMVLQGGNCVPRFATTGQFLMSSCPPGQYQQNDGSCGPFVPSTGPTMYQKGGRVRRKKGRR